MLRIIIHMFLFRYSLFSSGVFKCILYIFFQEYFLCDFGDGDGGGSVLSRGLILIFGYTFLKFTTRKLSDFRNIQNRYQKQIYFFCFVFLFNLLLYKIQNCNQLPFVFFFFLKSLQSLNLQFYYIRITVCLWLFCICKP